MVRRIVSDGNFVAFQKLALGILLCGLVLSLPSLCTSHGEHHHQHNSEIPSFKYSREANKNPRPKQSAPSAHIHDHKSEHAEIDLSSVWLHSMCSTLLISAAPFVLLYLIPLDNSEAMKPRLKVLLSFASGGLLGDAFLHLIPHAAHPHTHNHPEENDDHNHHGGSHHHHHHDNDDDGHDHKHAHDMTVGLWVLAGIIAFLAVEKIVRLLKGSHGHNHDTNGKVGSVGEFKKLKNSSKKEEIKKVKKIPEPGSSSEVEVAGYLNLAADFAHNFTDGLAIGASYLAGNSIGIVTTVTILLHEVPHEIGDFAILIKSGCSRRKAILLQLVTALGALAGTALALVGAGGQGSSPSWVLPFTAGGFIYIATVSVLPELLEGSTKLGQSIKEILALLIGVGLMVFIAEFE